MAFSGIYCIINKFNGKTYWGSSVDIKSRWRVHKSKLRNGIHENKHLQSSWNLYGESQFEFSIEELIDGSDAILLREQEILNSVVGKSNCYNSSIDATCPARGIAHTDAANKKRSNSLTGKVRSKSDRDSISKSMLGRKIEWSDKIRNTLSGVTCTKKLNPSKVRKIRKKYSSGKYTMLSLAKTYGCSETTIRKIIKNTIWKSVI